MAEISGATLWRWLDRDAIRPWRYRSWIFPRDPEFSEKAGRVLDLYEGRWENKPLGPKDFVLCADEKTSIQLRRFRELTRVCLRNVTHQPTRGQLTERRHHG